VRAPVAGLDSWRAPRLKCPAARWPIQADTGAGGNNRPRKQLTKRERIVMQVVTLKDIPIVPAEGAAAQIEGWSGPVFRTRQTIIQPGDSANYNCSVVNFSQGCTTGWHTHDCDQVLIVTSGSGMVATEHEQREINVGDVAHVKAGERHWHGAKADTTMGHITITLVGSKATWG
jgi:quercetin dioxygenase-like cupin family protein